MTLVQIFTSIGFATILGLMYFSRPISGFIFKWMAKIFAKCFDYMRKFSATITTLLLGVVIIYFDLLKAGRYSILSKNEYAKTLIFVVIMGVSFQMVFELMGKVFFRRREIMKFLS